MFSANRMLIACQLVGSFFVLCAPRASGVDQRLLAAIEQAKVQYQPVTQADLERSWSELSSATTDLERLLIPGSGRGERWKRYLRWQGLQQSLGKTDSRSILAMTTTLNRLSTGAAGTELPQFRRVRDAIEESISLVRIGRHSDQARRINGQLDRLSTYAQRYQESPSSRARYEMEWRLALFQDIGRSQKVVELLLNEFDHPNIQMFVSENMLNKLISQPINEISPVTDNILGTSIRGTGWTTGRTRIDLLPNSSRASLVMRAEGVTRSRTVGFNQPVVIRSRGKTPFTVSKRIDLEDNNFWAYRAKASATTSTFTESVKKQGGGLGNRIISRIGAKRVEESKPRANFIAARHAEKRLARGLDEELMPRLQEARYDYLNSFKQPLANRKAEPKYVRFATTSDSLNINMLEAVGGQFGAEASAVSLTGNYDLKINVHETGVANTLAVYLSGAELSQKTEKANPKLSTILPKFITDAIDTAREEADEEVPRPEDDRKFQPWSITFRRDRPVSVEFYDQQVKLVLHAANIFTKRNYDEGWDIGVVYRLHTQNGGLMLVRMGEIDVIPTAFDPADGKQIPGRYIGPRGVLIKELNRQADNGRGFPEEISIPMLDLPENFAEHGPLIFQDSNSESGWLSLGWNLPE